jgi:recombination protein RecR
MAKFPLTIEGLIAEFSRLPGVGRKTAERYVFFLMKNKKQDLEKFAQTILNLQSNLFICKKCGNFSNANGLCEICADAHRDSKILCLVEEAHDLTVIESTNEYQGLYHILGGTINPLEGLTEKNLNIKNLLERIKNDGIKEIIIALNPDFAGEATCIFLKKLLQPFQIKLTRLARGLPMGSDIEYADEVTLSNALKGRKEL